MKYLSDYMQEKQTEVFNNYGAFFAFSEKQLNEKKQDGVKYSSLGSGLICPKGKGKELMDALETIYNDAIKQDIAENGKDKIIERELGNYECYYTYDLEDAIAAVKDYNFTADDVKAVFHSR